MKLANATVLITGANRGLGLAFAREALERGARKIYAGARNPITVRLPGVEALRLDVTKHEDVVAASRQCGDVTLLINNAGIASGVAFLAHDSIDVARNLLETNFFGPLRLCQAFAPVLAANGGGAILNVLSVASWISSPRLAVYGASRSAAWSLTNGLRHELRVQNTQVIGMRVGFIDTDMARGFNAAKSAPEVVVSETFDALEAGAEEFLADAGARQTKRGLSAEPGICLQPIT